MATNKSLSLTILSSADIVSVNNPDRICQTNVSSCECLRLKCVKGLSSHVFDSKFV